MNCRERFGLSTYHFILSLGPEEKVELFNTSPISSLQKLKLFMVHMYENFTTLTLEQEGETCRTIRPKLFVVFIHF